MVTLGTVIRCESRGLRRGRLERLIRGVPRGVLTRRPGPGKWSIVEIVAHLADAELAMGWRLRSMLATPGVHLQWWDEQLWSEKCNYLRISPRALRGYVSGATGK